MRRGTILALVGIGVVAGGIATAVALLLPWLPEPASDEAGRIHWVFWFTTWICVVIFAIVTAAMVYAILRFRAQPDDDTDGPPTHGHTGLEIVWTIIPTILVTAIGIVSAIVLGKNDALGANTLRVNVTAQQFAWSFQYPGAEKVTTGILRVPVNRSLLLTFDSKDVIHSFWVPEWSQKQDTVPGIHPTLHITPNKVGRFDVICTELCGLGHAVMRTYAVVMTEQAFDKWLKSQGEATAAPSPSVSGAAIFENNQCGACHTFKPANASGTIGPDLDKLSTFAQAAGQEPEAFTKTSIENPNAYTEKGFPKNVMPPFDLPDDQLDALVSYLLSTK
jgi:cytochrome c oxidase subunit 2